METPKINPPADPNPSAPIPSPSTEDPMDKVYGMSVEEFNAALESGDIEAVSDDEEFEASLESGSPHSPSDPSAPSSATRTKPSPSQSYTIVHNGQEHVIDHDKMIELAQKGFDYDFKVGPHRKIVQLLDMDPAAQTMLNNYFSEKLGLIPPTQRTTQHPDLYRTPPPVSGPAAPAAPHSAQQVRELDLSGVKLKKLSEFDSEQEWFLDGMKQVVGEMRRQFPVPQQQPDPGQFNSPSRFPNQGPGAGVNALVGMIRNYDPQHNSMVLPVLDQYADQMTAAEYRVAISSVPNFLAFYDSVKERVLATSPTNPNTNPAIPGTGPSTPLPNSSVPVPPKNPADRGKRFTLKPGGSTPPKNKHVTQVNAWDLPRKEFDKLINSKLM